MSDYEDGSMMQNGSDDQPTKTRDPLDDEEEEGPGGSKAKKKIKVRVLLWV